MIACAVLLLKERQCAKAGLVDTPFSSICDNISQQWSLRCTVNVHQLTSSSLTGEIFSEQQRKRVPYAGRDSLVHPTSSCSGEAWDEALSQRCRSQLRDFPSKLDDAGPHSSAQLNARRAPSHDPDPSLSGPSQMPGGPPCGCMQRANCQIASGTAATRDHDNEHAWNL